MLLNFIIWGIINNMKNEPLPIEIIFYDPVLQKVVDRYEKLNKYWSRYCCWYDNNIIKEYEISIVYSPYIPTKI